jgi:hypothetical protein
MLGLLQDTSLNHECDLSILGKKVTSTLSFSISFFRFIIIDILQET